MWRTLRILVSVVFFALITFYFLDFAGISGVRSFLPRVQFIPALMAVSGGILVFWIVLTLLLGRVYCSSVCPLGIFQDGIIWVSKRWNKKKKYGYRPARNVVRWLVVGGIGIAFCLDLLLS